MGATNDKYICSSKRMRAVYKKRPLTFERKILYYLKVNNRGILLKEEQRWLSMIQYHELSKKYYNATNCAKFTSDWIKNHWEDPEKRKSHIESMMISNNDIKKRQAHSEFMKRRWQDPEFKSTQMPRLTKGRQNSEEAKKRIREAHVGSKRSEASRRRMSEAAKIRCSTPEYRENFRKRFHDDPEMKKKRDDALKASRSPKT